MLCGTHPREDDTHELEEGARERQGLNALQHTRNRPQADEAEGEEGHHGGLQKRTGEGRPPQIQRTCVRIYR